MAQAQYRPENALRRARDFESSGDKDKALDHLYEILAARRMGRQWQPAHEQMMMKFIELAVEYKEGRKCKDGLHAYRSLAQQQQPASLEKVVLYLIDISMRKAAEARARTDSAAKQLDTVEDLEEEESPEALLMGAVTSEGSRDRAEREILVPWVRHMWDTYRNVLDVLRNTPLENLYHVVARRAMAFCKEYNRGTEFRKLTALLRAHLLGIRRNLDTAGKGMTTDSVEKHVATRFVQLEHCADMAMWNEGFRTIEDIHEIMEGAGFTPKPQLMATYYEKLSRIFWVSENFLFHAYAWYRFFALSTSQNKVLTEEDRRTLADAALLAAMAIPIYSSGTGGGAGGALGGTSGTSLDVDVDERNKKNALANLLRVPTGSGLGPIASGTPSRSALLAELVSKGVLRMVHPEVAALYKALEGEFDPLGLVDKAKGGLGWVGAQTGHTLPSTIGIIGSANAAGAHSISQYGPKLERLCVFRLLEQLSGVYSTVTVSHFQSLIAPLKLSFTDVEKIAVKSVKERLLLVRIDHKQGMLRLGGRDGGDAGATRRQLADLASRLQAVLDGSAVGLSGDVAIAGAEASSAFSVPAAKREEVLTQARHMVEVARRWILDRKQTLQRRRERIELERVQAQRQAEEKAQKEAEYYRMMEAKRLEEEERARIEAKRKEIEEQQKKDEVLKMIAAAGRSLKDVEAAAVAHMDMATLEAQARERARKEIEAETRRRTEQARRVDYLIRALREAERPKIEAHLASLQADHESHVRAHNDAILSKARKHFEDASAMRSSMASIMPYVEGFEARVMRARQEEHAAQKKTKMDAEKLVFLRAKRERALKRKEIDERHKAEEAQIARENEKRKQEAEEHERMMAREAKRQQQDEEARIRREEASGSGDFRSRMGGEPAAAPSGAANFGAGGGWRGGAAGAGVGAAAAASAPAAGSEPWRPRGAGGGAAYVPPRARGAEPGDQSWRGASGAGGAAPSAAAPAPAPAAAPPAPAPAPARGSYVPPALRAQQASQQPAPSSPAPGPAPAGRRWQG